MPLPRPLVQFALNLFEELLRDVRKIGSLGDILTDESVSVLIGSTLPGMVRSGKEEAHTCCSGNSFALGELQAVVGSDGFHKVILLETFEDADYLVGSFRGGRVLELSEPHLLPDIILESAWQMAATPSVGGPLLSYPRLVTSVSAIAVSLNLLLRTSGLQFCSDLIPLPLF